MYIQDNLGSYGFPDEPGQLSTFSAMHSDYRPFSEVKGELMLNQIIRRRRCQMLSLQSPETTRIMTVDLDYGTVFIALLILSRDCNDFTLCGCVLRNWWIWLNLTSRRSCI